MSFLLSAELAATCSSLGYFDTKLKKYYADSNTLETVKDLIRYLRRDDETHEIRRYIGESQVLQTDLLPLLKGYWEQSNLFDVLLRLLVNLTSPALMLWNEVVPTEKTARYHYLKIEDHQQKYKQSFADERVWAVLSTRLSNILELDFVERGEENNLIIERILILIRNVLYIPANPDEERRPDNDASVHDQVLWSLHQSGMLDIILFIVSSTTEQAYYMHVLEILSFMLREQSATQLANTELQRSQTEKMRDEAELLLIRHHENNRKQEKIKKYCGARHSRFGGTFVMKSLQSISDKEYVYHKPLNKLDSVHFDVDKKKAKTPKNRLPFKEVSCERRSAFGVKLILKEFCAEFLNGAYNTFMHHVKDNFARAKAQAHDESYYLWAMRFFMEFNRGQNFQVKLTSETISVQSFHFVQQQMEAYYDCICVNKKDCKPWSRRLHVALLAYRELLLTLCAMDKSSDEVVRKSAKVIKSTIFYVVEYRELIVTLLITYDEVLFSLSYLNDLIETQHIFLKMLEVYCGKNEIVVQQKKKGKRKKKSTPAVTSPDLEQPNLDELWNEAAPQLSVLLGNSSTDIPDNIVPFDATSDVPLDEQKSEAMKNIQQYLRDSEFENALGLLRSSREVWPENDCFGSLTMAPEEELLVLQDIFLANFGGGVNASVEAVKHNVEDEYSNEEDEELETMVEPDEANFKFIDFLKRFANQKIVQACALALKNFENNSVHTNYCILKLLHRIVWDLKMATIVFQASIFRTFQRAYSLKDLPQYKDLIKFAAYILRQFFKLAEKNPKIFMEALFWKSSRDTFDIEEGYGSYNEKSKIEAQAWSEVQEIELTTLYNEHQEKGIEEDVIDWICSNLVDYTRTRRAVIHKLTQMSLISNYKKSKSVNSRSKVWTENEEQQLREVFEEFKDADNPIQSIVNALPNKRPRIRIIEKLLEMKVIQNKNEVLKKRVKNLRMAGREDGTSDRGSEINSDSSEEDDNSVINIPKRKKSMQQHKRVRQVHISKVDLTKLLNKVLHMSDALEWLKESLSDIIEDRKENDEDLDLDDGIPLVAIMDYSVTAIEDKDFQNLLKGIGLRQPADEQETHWRIPNAISLSSLEEYCQLLNDAISNNLCNPDENPVNAQSDDDEDVFDRIKQITNNYDLPSTSSNVPGSSNINEITNGDNTIVSHLNVDAEIETDPGNVNKNLKPSRNKLFDSDDDDIDENQQQPCVSKNRKNIISSDSDEDSDGTNLTNYDNKRDRAASDKNSKPSWNKLFGSDDDDDVEENQQQTCVSKNRKNIISTDSDEDSDGTNLTNYDNKRDRAASDKNSKPSRNKLFGSDDDDDLEENQQHTCANKHRRNIISSDSDGTNLTNYDNKRDRAASDTDSPLKKKKRSRILVSDDESS